MELTLWDENEELIGKKDKTDKVIADIEGLKIETTFELLQNQDYELWDDGSYMVNVEDGRLVQAVELDPNGYYVETLLKRFKSGYSIILILT